MLSNYFKIILRNFRSDRLCSLIIIVGLAVGLAAGLMIVQYVHFELSFDKQYEGAEDIYYVYTRWDHPGGTSGDDECPSAVGPVMQRTIPEVQFSARLVPVGRYQDLAVIRWGPEEDRSFIQEEKIFAADADIVKIFGISFLRGDANTALKEPNSVVLTQKLSDKIFPDSDPINQILRFRCNEVPMQFKVTGVVEDLPVNSSLQFNALISFFSMEDPKKGYPWGFWNEAWEDPNYRTFVKLHPGTDALTIEKKINEVGAAEFRKIYNDHRVTESVRLHPFTDFHFYKRYSSSGLGAVQFTGDKRIIEYFSILACFILVISWANSINLTTARALRRAKEVGLRKVNGASRRQIIWQFLLEFLFTQVVSLLVAFTIVQLLFHEFTSAIGSQAAWIFWRMPQFWIFVAIFLFSSAVVSGFYPALVMSGYNPSRVLKGNFSRSRQGSHIRSGLIVAQFVFTVLLLTSLYIVTLQFNYIQRRDTGLSTEQLVYIQVHEPDTLSPELRSAAYRQWSAKVRAEDFVINTCAGYGFPTFGLQWTFRLPADDTKKFTFHTNSEATEDMFATMNMNFLQGRDFMPDQPGEADKIIINEMAARELGFSDLRDAIGERIVFDEWEKKEFQIIGVVSNATVSKKLPFTGQAYLYKWIDKGYKINYVCFLVKLAPTTDLDKAVSRLREHWMSVYPNDTFDFHFADDLREEHFKDDRQFTGVFVFFAIIGVIITCMGLFGLSLYNANSRTKEVGIRKSLGGSASSIMWLFSKEYIRLIVVAALIGAPLAIWGLSGWLKNYPNRISVNADAVVIPLVVTVLIAVLTVAYHTYKTAHANPVMSLRSE